MGGPQHIVATTSHARRGALRHSFRHSVDYVLIDPEVDETPALFARNRFNVMAVHDRDHGGAPEAGQGVEWARRVFAEHGLQGPKVLLLTQPRFMGYVFNPVSFWLAMEDDYLLGVIAEVNNTYGDRHSYVCVKPDLSPIAPDEQLQSTKLMHVSPFQDVAGGYVFTFNIRPEKIAIRIDFRVPGAGLVATLVGPREPLRNSAILYAALRRPAGAFRTTVLIYWHALRLKLKGAVFRSRPLPPENEVS